MTAMWRYLVGSETGLSHERDQLPCQDWSYASRLPGPTGAAHYLVLACADGAGSASHAHKGAEAACIGFARACERSCSLGHPEAATLTEQNAESWFAEARDHVVQTAECLGVEARQTATTLLAAVLGEEIALFMQLGDGAIVTSNGQGCSVVFWPDRGEYANETTFLTDPAWRASIRASVAGRVDELALFTDGLQSVALHYATQTTHDPFFLSMFGQIRDTPDWESLRVPLSAYLKSEALRKRTDDDVTLLLATRRARAERDA